MRRFFNIHYMVALLITCMAAGCASEAWNNPRDPAGTTWSGCPRVSEDSAERCLFHEDFGGTLDRWQVSTRPGDGQPVSVRGLEVDGATHLVAAVPACAGEGSASLNVELQVPDQPLALTVFWKEPLQGDGGLTVSANEAIRPTGSVPTGQWRRTVEHLEPPPSGRILLRLYNGVRSDCSELYIDSVLLETRP